MPGFTANIHDFQLQIVCAMHRSRVVGRVLELNADRGKCLDSRDDSCSDYWYVEGTYTDFHFPGDEHVDPERTRRPTG